jgi:hypothetical protein
MSESHVCVWLKDEAGERVIYYCECGMVSLTKPETFVEQVDECEVIPEEKCKHEWECLKDRCHNRGTGKYKAYKCRLCGKFQRR